MSICKTDFQLKQTLIMHKSHSMILSSENLNSKLCSKEATLCLFLIIYFISQVFFIRNREFLTKQGPQI